MATSLICQATHTDIQVGLCVDTVLLEQIQVHKHAACAKLMPLINALLKKHNLTWTEISFVGTNQGPAPFTTLRVLIATVNGIAFATKIPLVGIDGLEVLWKRAAGDKNQKIIVLLNAFNQDVYYAYEQDGALIRSCQNIDMLLKDFVPKQSTFTFAGQGAVLHQDKISQALDKRANFLSPQLEWPHLEDIINTCINNFAQNKTATQLEPLYLKQAVTNAQSQVQH